jgi:BlaI family penicillinase repressor
MSNSPNSSPKPTDSELSILRVLWEQGDCTVRQVSDELNRDRETGYTTVLKLMQIMLEKGLVARDASQRTHVYRAKFSAERTQRQLVADLVHRAFGGSSQKLVMQALAAKKASKEELAEIQKLINEMKGGSK